MFIGRLAKKENSKNMKAHVEIFCFNKRCSNGSDWAPKVNAHDDGDVHEVTRSGRLATVFHSVRGPLWLLANVA